MQITSLAALFIFSGITFSALPPDPEAAVSPGWEEAGAEQQHAGLAGLSLSLLGAGVLGSHGATHPAAVYLEQKLIAPEVIPAAGMPTSFSLIVSRLWGESY